MGYEYLVRGAVLKCTCGSSTSKLNLPVDHGTYLPGGQPQINRKDAVGGVNIMPFGSCRNLNNNPCSPAIVGMWLNPEPTTMAGNDLAVTTDSFLVCVIGGLIEPQTSGQENALDPSDLLVLMSKSSHERPDSGLSDLSDEEISRRARDKSLSGEERRRYQKEEKIRGNRNKQKRKNHYSFDLDAIGEIVGLTGTALVIYLIISEGSRILFPPRNLIPIL